MGFLLMQSLSELTPDVHSSNSYASRERIYRALARSCSDKLGSQASNESSSHASRVVYELK